MGQVAELGRALGLAVMMRAMYLKLTTLLLAMGLFGFYGCSKSKESSEPTRLLHRGMDLSEAGNYAEAIILLTQAITADTNNAQAYFERGMARLGLDKTADAINDFGRALAIDPNYPGARNWRARAAASLGDHQSAAEDRLADLRAHPDGRHKSMGVEPQQWAECAESFVNTGNSLKAKALLEEYYTNYAGKVTSYADYETAPLRMFATLLIQSGDFARACEVAGKAHSNKHKLPVDALVYAQALEASGDLASARRICAEAMKLNDQMAGLKELNERLSR